jgi:hypothetical protein
MEKEKIRHFGGELFVFVDYSDLKKSKVQRIIRNLEKKHLKAYLRGDKKFSFGLDMHGRPMWYFVKEVWV